MIHAGAGKDFRATTESLSRNTNSVVSTEKIVVHASKVFQVRAKIQSFDVLRTW
jgi:hypothetical protein